MHRLDMLQLEYVLYHLCEEYEALKANPEIKFPEKHMLKTLKRKECYQGCFSKWQQHRVANSWDAFVEVATELAKKHSEIPNAFRKTLQISCQKWSGSRYATGDMHSLPEPLALAIESMLVDAMTTGQEVGFNFIVKTMNFMLSLWNDRITEIRSHLQSKLQDQATSDDHIGPSDALVDVNGDRVACSSGDDHQEKMLGMLQTCNVTMSADARRPLGWKCVRHHCVCSTLCIYIYMLTATGVLMFLLHTCL